MTQHLNAYIAAQQYSAVVLISGPNDWPQRIGVAERLTKRFANIQAGNWEELQLTAHWYTVGKAVAQTVVHHAKSALADRHIRGDWFDVSSAEAVRVIEDMCATLDVFVMDMEYIAREMLILKEGLSQSPEWVDRRLTDLRMSAKNVASVK